MILHHWCSTKPYLQCRLLILAPGELKEVEEIIEGLHQQVFHIYVTPDRAENLCLIGAARNLQKAKGQTIRQTTLWGCYYSLYMQLHRHHKVT